MRCPLEKRIGGPALSDGANIIRPLPIKPLLTIEESEMSISILDMSMSLDGYIADADDYLGGEDGERLHEWADVDREPGRSESVREFEAEWKAAGAVLAGRRTAELMDHWGGSHGGLPIFVPSHRPRLRPRVGDTRW